MKLTVKKGKGDKLHLYIDGEYFITVDEGYFLSLGYSDGVFLDEEQLSELEDNIKKRRAYNNAVSLLSLRDHSTRELIDKLKMKGHGEYSFFAVERLSEQGYLDDERFALNYAKELIRLKSYGKRRVEQELYRKGIERDIVYRIIDSCEFEKDVIIKLIERKYVKYLSDSKGVTKTVNSLIRLGYSYSDIRDALKEFVDREEFNVEQ